MGSFEEANGETRRRIRKGGLLPKQQMFAKNLAEGMPGKDAYQKAYGCSVETAKVNSWKLSQRPEVVAEVRRLSKEIGVRNKVTQDEIIENLRKARETAFEDGKLNEAIRATVALGQYLGMFNQKVDINMREGNPFRTGDDEKDRERLAKIGGLLRPKR